MKILRSELENAKKSEEKVIVMEGLIENLRMEIFETRKKTEMGKVVQKWTEKSKDLKRRVEEALQSERIAVESLLIASNKLRESRSSLKIAESELIGLKFKVNVLEIELSRRGAVQADPENGNKQACSEMVEMGTMIEALKSEIRKDLQQKLLSIDFKKQIHGNDMCDDFGLQVMIIKVPRYILDNIWAKYESCKIICTQPRRISAVSVAERISYERGEKVGDTIGYKIRLESQGGKQSSIMFCTTGILLRILLGRVDMSKMETTSSSVIDEILEISHIMVDEIHERDWFSDLTILSDLLVFYPHLRLILVSATMDSDRFSQYFNGCPVIFVPGFTYPVESFYLEDALSFLYTPKENHLDLSFINGSLESTELTDDFKSLLDQSIDLPLNNDEIDSLADFISSDSVTNIVNYQHSVIGVSPLMVFTEKGRIDETQRLLSFGANCYLNANDGTTVLDCAQRAGHDKILEMVNEHMKEDTSKITTKNDLLDKYMALNNNPENVDTKLSVSLLRKIRTNS
ncbi:hypothetical protein ZOSMA_77G00020 [Zostera marina]|uniref:Helicase ATP-binding domain-containing protein n=1 Tax=Zostera marina TaxID=29655 RepID=A0A0K9NQT7_ZOSMR|nr:hypothetical protein ZOSMA_77G00020 [Zostera marina]